MASLRSLGVSIRLGEATVWNAYRPLFLAYISSDQTLTSGLGGQHGASRCLTNSLLIRFCQRTFRKEKLVVFAAPSHPLARNKQLSFSDLRQAPLVTTGMTTGRQDA